MVKYTDVSRLNAICAYFTMFPLEFPKGYLSRHATGEECVLDPFCGRGTTNFAARLLGLPTIGIDSSPVATALTEAKLVAPPVKEILSVAKEILATHQYPREIPDGRFWELAYHPDVLTDLCRLREGLLDNCDTPARIALRGILMGALHGPLRKTPSYLSNQAPRTFAPKPDYSIRFWQERDLRAPAIDIIEIIRMRARRYYGTRAQTVDWSVVLGDSSAKSTFHQVDRALKSFGRKVTRIVTSPPYYGLRTYIPDQWLRNWLVGGPSYVDYNYDGQISHSSQEEFIRQIRRVWNQAASISAEGATLVVRFGCINERKVDPKRMIKATLEDTPWRITTIRGAGTANRGRRQANAFNKHANQPNEEIDVYAVLHR